jgi:NAD(P)-dependent dehydrogenase (short-subunit alcohol dehydrogenase family)
MATNETVTPLDGRVAVVTGGSRGLGLAMATAFAEAGADLVIASRKLDVCQAAATAISDKTGRRAVPVATHVGRWEDCDDLFERSIEAFGDVDILVNNAGMSPLYPTLGAVTEDLWRKVIDVNLSGPFRLSALFGERMKARGRGSIINITSAAAVRPTPRELPYAAAKAGVHVLTVGFAQALGPEVRVNTIMAGPFFTDISTAWDMDEFKKNARNYPLQRGGEPEEIVGAALYFASDGSSFTTGAVLPVDGGSSVARL